MPGCANPSLLGVPAASRWLTGGSPRASISSEVLAARHRSENAASEDGRASASEKAERGVKPLTTPTSTDRLVLDGESAVTVLKLCH